MARLLSYIVGLIVIFGLGNILLHYGQEWYHRADQKELDSIKIKLNNLKNEIDTMESKIKAKNTELENKYKSIQKCKSIIKQYEIIGNSMTDMEYENYENTLTICNENIDEYNIEFTNVNSAYDSYKENIDTYNSLIPKANELAKKVGSKWYIVPIPIPSRSR